MSNARGLPPKVPSELEGRLIKAGSVNVEVTIKDIPMNYSGKIGELFWGDYKKGNLTLRPVLAKSNLEWEDEATYEALINQCGEEVKNNKTIKHVSTGTPFKIENLRIDEKTIIINRNFAYYYFLLYLYHRNTLIYH